MKAATTATKTTSRRPLSLVNPTTAKSSAKKTAPAKKSAPAKKVAKAATAAAAPQKRKITATTTDVPDTVAVAEQAEGQKIFLEAEGRIPDAQVPEDPMVTAIIPKAFWLQLDHEKKVHYPQGTQEMPTSHADHWFARANGVVKYTGKK